MATKKNKKKDNPRVLAVQEQKKKKTLLIGFIVTGVIIVGLILYAVIYALFIKDSLPVATVGGEKIDNDYFIARTRLQRHAYIQQFLQLNFQAQAFGENSELSGYYVEQMQQIMAILDAPASFSLGVLEEIVDDEIIAQKAEEMGITVSDAEVDVLIQEIFRYFPNGTPTPRPTIAPFEAPPVTEAQEAILNLIPTSVAEGIEIGSDGELPGIVAEPTATVASPTATTGPTATPYTVELFQDQFNTYLTELENINVNEKYLRIYLTHYLIKDKVQEAVSADVPLEQEMVWARHILVSDEDTAKEVLVRLETENWNEVAAEVSLDTSNKDNGGDLGWFSQNQMVEEFDQAVFAMDVGTISAPIETQFGWHIIQLVDKATLALSQSDLEYKQNLAFEEWVLEAKDSIKWEINDVYKDLAPLDPKLSDFITFEQPTEASPSEDTETVPAE